MSGDSDVQHAPVVGDVYEELKTKSHYVIYDMDTLFVYLRRTEGAHPPRVVKRYRFVNSRWTRKLA
ncbi:MAG: hypothetical protein IT435_02535 [Phycisphaerales bacterium]|nr:hypothetical protein [Phycisphaerales bacterium]